jgi:hypothetical protein
VLDPVSKKCCKHSPDIALHVRHRFCAHRLTQVTSFRPNAQKGAGSYSKVFRFPDTVNDAVITISRTNPLINTTGQTLEILKLRQPE